MGEGVVDDIVDFVDINKKRLRELSLRTVLKVADLAKAFPDRWGSHGREYCDASRLTPPQYKQSVSSPHALL